MATALSAQRSMPCYAGLRPSVALQRNKHAPAPALSSARASRVRRQGRRTPVTITAGLKIIFVSMEVAPWSKTGGLGDVLGALPIALAQRGHHVMTVAPRYDHYLDVPDSEVRTIVKWHHSAPSVTMPADPNHEEVRFFQTFDNGVDRVFVDHPCFSARILPSPGNPMGKTGNKIYVGYDGKEYEDNDLRFSLICQAALAAAIKIPHGGRGGETYGEDVVFVANDWHTAPLPVMIKHIQHQMGHFKHAPVAFCIHNIAYQGRYDTDKYERLNMPQSAFPSFEFKPAAGGRKLNWLKAGFLNSDKLLTVSPGYAAEIMTPEKSNELDSVLKQVGGVEGIVNGMDDVMWNPQTDKFLAADCRYSADDLSGKARAKAALQRQFGLNEDPNAALLAFVGRLDDQKGVDILLHAVPAAIAEHRDAQLVLLGSGSQELEAGLTGLSSRFPGRAAGVAAFSVELSHQINAGADYVLVPSRFEPCGLVQMNGMRYGTIPIVASTGGLIDTVPAELGFQIGPLGLAENTAGARVGDLDYGFVDCEGAESVAACIEFRELHSDVDRTNPTDVRAVTKAISTALQYYGTPQFEAMRVAGMQRDWSWREPAAKWENVLQKLVAERLAAV